MTGWQVRFLLKMAACLSPGFSWLAGNLCSLPGVPLPFLPLSSVDVLPVSGLWPLKKINKGINHIGLGVHPTVWAHFNLIVTLFPNKVQGVRNFFLEVGGIAVEAYVC